MGWLTKPWKTPYGSQVMQGFARTDPTAESVADATKGSEFRRLLETHDLCKGLFTAINADRTALGLLLRQDTLMDATLIAGRWSMRCVWKGKAGVC